MKTIKVRIAVGVDNFGGWHAYGYSGASLEELDAEVCGSLDYPFLTHWIEAEVPMPEQITIEGKIKDNL